MKIVTARQQKVTRYVSLFLSTLCLPLMLTGVFYSITKSLSEPTTIIPAPSTTTLGSSIQSIHSKKRQAPISQNTISTPFFDVFPTSDGTELRVQGRLNNAGQTQFYANIIYTENDPDHGDTHFKDSYTMTYSETLEAHSVTFMDFSERFQIAGSIHLTTTANQSTQQIAFNRSFVPIISPAPIRSTDGLLEIDLLNPDTIRTDTYVVIAENHTPPGPPPPGHRIVGKAYSVRAPDTMVGTDKPMTLQMSYSLELLQGADPLSLAIFTWDDHDKAWVNFGGRLLRSDNQLTKGIERFAIYALMVMPNWQDHFTNNQGMAQRENVASNGLNLRPALVMTTTPGVGQGVSIPITPSTGVEQWSNLFFTATVNPPTNSLTVDILGANGSLLFNNVSSGMDLADIDPLQHPSLQLRVNMTATTTESPQLHSWRLIWRAPADARVQIGDVSAKPGEAITVPVDLIGVLPSGLGSATFEVRYDPALLNVTGCTVDPEHQFLDGFCNIDFERDGLDPDVVRFNVAATMPVTGNIPIAQLAFVVVGAPGDSTLNVTNIHAATPDGVFVPLIEQDGQVTIAPGMAGDVNCDDLLEATDARLILQFDVGLIVATSQCQPSPSTFFLPQCDVNDDSVCNAADAVAIFQSE